MKLKTLTYDMCFGMRVPFAGDFICSIVKQGTAIGSTYHIVEAHPVKKRRLRYKLKVLKADDMKPFTEISDGVPCVRGVTAFLSPDTRMTFPASSEPDCYLSRRPFVGPNEAPRGGHE